MRSSVAVLGWMLAFAWPCASAFAQDETDGEEEVELSSELDEDEDQDELADDGEPSSVGVSVGVKLGGGGQLLTAPSNVPPSVQPFDDGAGGYAFTFGPFVELRFLDGLLGAQTGLIFDFATNLSEIDINGVETNWGWSSTDLRIPLLLQLGTTGEGTRLYVTTGPEVVIGLGADGTIENFAVAQFSVEPVTRVNWAVGLGLNSAVSVIRMSFDVQFAYNLGIASIYDERVSAFPAVLSPASIISTDAQSTMDLRLLIGASYDFTSML